jgi:hypothetical protein
MAMLSCYHDNFIKYTIVCRLRTMLRMKMMLTSLEFKGIGSRDLGSLCLISLERYEVGYRAGSGLFLIFWRFQISIIKKLTFAVQSNLELLILELLLFGGFFSQFDLADLNQRP